MTVAESLDYQIFGAINGFAGRSEALDTVMIACAKYLPIVFALALVGLWLSWKPGNQRAAFLAAASALIALGFGQLVGIAFPRARPYLSHSVNLLIGRSADTSFPSDHATLGFAVAVLIWRFNRPAGIALLLLAIILAFSRVFVGAHYPGDVLGGAMLGTGTSFAIAALSQSSPLGQWLDRGFDLLARLHLSAQPASPIDDVETRSMR